MRRVAAAVRPAFAEQVYRTVRRIPAGRVVTYGQVARAVGRSGAARAVGNALASNPNPYYKQNYPRVPCHRVVRSDGSLGGFSGPVGMKTKLLQREGVHIVAGRVTREHLGTFHFSR